jgi:hypothetical protein
LQARAEVALFVADDHAEGDARAGL